MVKCHKFPVKQLIPQKRFELFDLVTSYDPDLIHDNQTRKTVRRGISDTIHTDLLAIFAFNMAILRGIGTPLHNSTRLNILNFDYVSDAINDLHLTCSAIFLKFAKVRLTVWFLEIIPVVSVNARARKLNEAGLKSVMSWSDTLMSSLKP